MTSIGLGKTNFNSSVTLLTNNSSPITSAVEIILTERHDRIKLSGAWPYRALNLLLSKIDDPIFIAENRDVNAPAEHEATLNIIYPFKEFLKSKKLGAYSSLLNSSIQFVPHHLSHAYAAMAFSPFVECLILVLDGGGSRHRHLELFPNESQYKTNNPENNEYRSVYLLQNGKLNCVHKDYQSFHKNKAVGDFSSGIGSFYEKIAEFVFNTPEAEGKLMGLAAYSSSNKYESNLELSKTDFINNLILEKAFKGSKKKTWDDSDHKEYYMELAYIAQKRYEEELFKFLQSIKIKFPSINSLILTGGCALNCTANAKIYASKIFNDIYIPPNPGDGSISLGCAYGSSLKKEQRTWKLLSHTEQSSSLGSKESCPENYNLLEIFKNFEIEKPKNLCLFAATQLSQNKIIAWFQGRSECGPRALGNRSILAHPTFPLLKDYLNEKIKFRESFRPYGCSVIWEEAHNYFNCALGFNNPFMSFAIPVKQIYLNLLKEVTHTDQTSRMQTVRIEQNKLFYQLLKETQKLTNVPILLNTSLNIMNEPILETPHDALRFLQNSRIDGLAIGEFYIFNKKYE